MTSTGSEFQAPKTIVCVGAVVLRERSVLFVRQTYGDLKGQWSLPWGFFNDQIADAPDSPDRAVLREVREEAGVIAEVEGLLGVQSHHTKQGEPAIYLLFLCRHLAGEPAADNSETDRAAYFSLEDIQRFDEPFDSLCEWIARRVLGNDYHLVPPVALNPYQPCPAFF